MEVEEAPSTPRPTSPRPPLTPPPPPQAPPPQHPLHPRRPRHLPAPLPRQLPDGRGRPRLAQVQADPLPAEQHEDLPADGPLGDPAAAVLAAPGNRGEGVRGAPRPLLRRHPRAQE